MTIKEKLAQVQAELNAPKNRMNKFGGYAYRSCEDILEAVKPLLKKVGAGITVSDSIEQIGDRYYVRALARFFSLEDDAELIGVEAYAREPETKKGMDEAQITGTASSYARKYALNGLLLIDDNKDPDSDEYTKVTTNKEDKKPQKSKTDASDLDKFITSGQMATIEMLLGKAGVTAEKFCGIYKIAAISELLVEEYDDAVKKLEVAAKQKEGK